MKDKRIIFPMSLVLLITACNDSNIQKVKNYIFSDIDSTVKAGDALSNRDLCKDIAWSESQDKQKRLVVSYSCELKTPKFNSYIKNLTDTSAKSEIFKIEKNESANISNLNKSIDVLTNLNKSEALNKYFVYFNELIKNNQSLSNTIDRTKDNAVRYIFDQYPPGALSIVENSEYFNISNNEANKKIISNIKHQKDVIKNIFIKNKFTPDYYNRSTGYSTLDFDLFNYLNGYFDGNTYWSEDNILKSYLETKREKELNSYEKIRKMQETYDNAQNNLLITSAHQNIEFFVIGDNVKIDSCSFTFNNVTLAFKSDVEECVKLAYSYEYNSKYNTVIDNYIYNYNMSISTNRNTTTD